MNDLPILNHCVNLLMEQLANKQEDLRRAETSQGKGHDVPKMNKLRKQIASIETRLSRAERLYEAALARPDRNVL